MARGGALYSEMGGALYSVRGGALYSERGGALYMDIARWIVEFLGPLSD